MAPRQKKLRALYSVTIAGSLSDSTRWTTMGNKSQIEWTDSTWTPIRARVRDEALEIEKAKGYDSLLPLIHPGAVGPHCESVSEACRNCYSQTNNHRCLPSNGTGLPF